MGAKSDFFSLVEGERETIRVGWSSSRCPLTLYEARFCDNLKPHIVLACANDNMGLHRLTLCEGRNGGRLLDGDLAGRVVDADEVDAGGDAGGDCRGGVEARHADADGVVYAHIGGYVARDGYLAGGGLHGHDA